MENVAIPKEELGGIKYFVVGSARALNNFWQNARNNDVEKIKAQYKRGTIVTVTPGQYLELSK